MTDIDLLNRELKDWCSSNSHGLSGHDKLKLGDAATVFIANNKFRIFSYSRTLQYRRMENNPVWTKDNFEALEAKIAGLQDEIKYLRTLI